MRRICGYSALLVAVALLSPEDAFAEQPTGMVAADVGTPDTVAWSSRAPDMPRIPGRPGISVPTIGPRGEAPGDLSVGRSKSSEVRESGGVATGSVADEAAFLLPTWDRGFWVMPPGGLTRFLIPARGFINPEESLARDPANANSG